MIPHQSHYPPTTLPPTTSSYSSTSTNPPRPTSSSLERLPHPTSLNEYRSLAYLQNPYLSQRHITPDLKVPEFPTIASQRYNPQHSDRQVPFRTSSASPVPYESQTSVADSKRGSSYLQETFKPIQSSQNSYNNLTHQFASKSDSQRADTFFTFKKDSNQFINFSDMSSVHYASSEPQDSVVNKILFSAESKKFRAEARFEENKTNNNENSLQLPTEPNKPKSSLETPNKLIKCLELLNTPSTPPKTDTKAGQFSIKQPCLESPDLQQSLEPIMNVAPPSVATNQVKTRLISEITAFNFDSVCRDNESNSLMKNSLRNPSYCTQSPSMKYNSHPVNRFDGAKEYEKELGLNNYKSQGPEEPKNIANHNYYSYLSSITLQSDEQGKGKDRMSLSKRSISSQPSIRQQMSLQEIGSKNSLDTRKAESQQTLDRGDEGYIMRKKDSPGRESRKSVNKLKSILKPNMSNSSSNSPENKKRVSYSSEVVQTEENNTIEQTNKYIQRLQAAAKTEKDVSPDKASKQAEKKNTEEGEIRESTEEWLQKANSRASQILGRLSQRRAVSPMIPDQSQSQSQSQIQQDKTQRSMSSMREEKQETEKRSFRSESLNQEQKPVDVSVAARQVPKEERKSPEGRSRGRVQVEVKISDLLLIAEKAEKSQSPPKRIEGHVNKEKKEEKIEMNQSNTAPKASSAEENVKVQDSTQPTFCKEKPVVKEEVRPFVQAIKQITKLEVIKEQSSGRDSQRKSEQDTSKEYKNSSNRVVSANTRGTNGLDTSDMQYSDSQASSNNIVCIGSRVPTNLSKEAESRQLTEEGAAVGKPDSLMPSQRQTGYMETPEKANDMIKADEISERLVYFCRSLKEKEFAVPNYQAAANVADLEEFQKIIMNKIEGIHTDIIDKINLISKKIDSESQYATTATYQDGTCSPYVNHSFSEVPLQYHQLAKDVKPPQYPHHQHQHQNQHQQHLHQQQQQIQQQTQQSNNASVTTIENNQKTTDNGSSEIYEYDSQSRTYSIRQNPIQTPKQEIKTPQRTNRNMENPFSNRSKSRERLGSNCTSVNTSNNASIICDQLSIENAEKKACNNIPIPQDLMQQQKQRQPKSTENKSSKQLQQELFTNYTSKLQQQRITTKLANMIPRDLPRPLTSKSQNKLSPNKLNVSDLQYKYASQSESVTKQRKVPGLSYCGSAPRGLFEGDLSLNNNSFSEKKECLESELNKSWGTNIRFSAKRNAMAPKEKSPTKSSPQKATRSSMSSQSSDIKSREYREQQSKSYLVLSPDYSIPASKDSHRYMDTVSTQNGGQVHSVNHEMQRLEKKLEKYLKAGPAFELETINEMANSEAYLSQGLGVRAQSLTKVGSAKQLEQSKKSEGTQSTKALNKWQTKEITSNRGGSYGQIPKAGKKVSSNSFRGKDRCEREEMSPDNYCNLSKDKSMEKSPGIRSANKVKGFIQDNGGKPAPRKSICY